MPKHTITTRADPEFPYRRWFYAEDATSSPDEEIYGHCARVALDTDASNYALVFSLFVPKQSRGKGVGAALMDAVIAHAHNQGLSVKPGLFLNATPFGHGQPNQAWLLRWYQKFGFARCYQPSGALHPYAMVL